MKVYSIESEGFSVGKLFAHDDNTSVLLRAFILAPGLVTTLARGKRLVGEEWVSTLTTSGDASGWVNDEDDEGRSPLVLTIGSRVSDHTIGETQLIGHISGGDVIINPRFLAAEWRDAEFKLRAMKSTGGKKRSTFVATDDIPF